MGIICTLFFNLFIGQTIDLKKKKMLVALEGKVRKFVDHDCLPFRAHNIQWQTTSINNLSC